MPIFVLDYLLFSKIHGLAGKWPVIDFLIVFLAQYLPWLISFLLLMFFLKNRKRLGADFKRIIASVVLSRLVIAEIVSLLFYRLRPFAVLMIEPLFKPYFISSSFPSGHAAFCFALAMAVFFIDKRIGWFCFFSAFLVVFARIAAGVHWPSDIIAGGLIGIFSAIAINILQSKKPLFKLKSE